MYALLNENNSPVHLEDGKVKKCGLFLGPLVLDKKITLYTLYEAKGLSRLLNVKYVEISGDPHTDTSSQLGLSRQEAKEWNFYGLYCLDLPKTLPLPTRKEAEDMLRDFNFYFAEVATALRERSFG